MHSQKELSLNLIGMMDDGALVLSFVNAHSNDGCIVVDGITVDSHKIDKIIRRVVEAFGGAAVSVNDSRQFGFVVLESTTVRKLAILFKTVDYASVTEMVLVGEADMIATVHEAMKDLIQLDTVDGDYDINISNYFKQGPKLKAMTVTKAMSDFAYISDELYPRINVHDMVQSYISSTENILILTGEPGTGKTTFIKKVMASIAAHKGEDIVVAYIKDQNLLQDNETWTSLTGNEYDLLVFDDLDDSLDSRKKGGNNTFISQLLSFSDGIFDKNTKIIITTNRPIEDIDTAVIRPGRCFDILNMPTLTGEEALTAWTEVYMLSAESFREIFGHPETVTQAYLSSEAKSVQSDLPKTYLRDQSISIRKQFMK